MYHVLERGEGEEKNLIKSNQIKNKYRIINPGDTKGVIRYTDRSLEATVGSCQGE